MDLLAQVLLTIVYLLVLPVRLVRAVLGHDKLRLRRPLNAASYWVVRDKEPNSQSYFSEASLAEGCPGGLAVGQFFSDRGAARWFTPMLRLIARLYALPRERAADKYDVSADRGASIPDEVYTLW
jgi:hypothetical protein